PEINIAVYPFICDPKNLRRLFNRNISRNIWKLINICHESSLDRDILSVNWTSYVSFTLNKTLFPIFDKSIEIAIECVAVSTPFTSGDRSLAPYIDCHV